MADGLPIWDVPRHTRQMDHFQQMVWQDVRHQLRRDHQQDLALMLASLLVTTGGSVACMAGPGTAWTVVLPIISVWLMLGVIIGARRFRGRPYYPHSSDFWELVEPLTVETEEAVRAAEAEVEAEIRAELRSVPVLQVYALCSLVGVAWYGVRGVIGAFDAQTSLSPADAPAVMASVFGLPALLTAVITAVPLVIRAWGAQKKTSGEGEAAVIRAKAELRRADAEYLRAEKGLTPLNSASDGPPALEPTPDPA